MIWQLLEHAIPYPPPAGKRYTQHYAEKSLRLKHPNEPQTTDKADANEAHPVMLQQQRC